MSCALIRVVDVPIKGRGIGRWIELGRPEKLNCLSLDMLNDLWSALQESDAAAWVGLTGAGRSFCTGLDLNEILSPGGAPQPGARTHLERLVSIFRWFLAVKVPTFVLARGYAAGGGSGLVACARTAVVSDDFRLRLPGGRLAEFAVVAVPLLKLRARGKCRVDSDWLGQEFTAREAHRLGLVDAVVSAEDLGRLALRITSGEIVPQLLPEPMRDESAVALADSELERILGALASAPTPAKCSAGPRTLHSAPHSAENSQGAVQSLGENRCVRLLNSFRRQFRRAYERFGHLRSL